MRPFSRDDAEGTKRVGFALLWLIYMGVPVFYLVQEPMEQAVAGLSLCALYVALYVVGFRSNERVAFACAFAMAAITCGLSLLTDGTMLTIGFFVVALAMRQTRIRNVVAVMLAMFAAVAFVLLQSWRTMGPTDWANLLPPLVIMFAFPFVAKALRRTRELRQELDTANVRIKQLIQQEERERIARDLHDTLGQTLTLITMKSELADRLVSRDPDKAKAEIKEIRNTARAALRQIRELLTDMRALRLSEEMERSRQVLASANIELAFVGEREAVQLHAVESHVLAFCLRETVTNVIRHSGANHCEIGLTLDAAQAVLTVSDDGRGLPLAGGEPTDPSGNGLRNMQERLSFIGGTWSVHNRPAGGSRIVMKVPLAMRAKEPEPERAVSAKEGVFS